MVAQGELREPWDSARGCARAPEGRRRAGTVSAALPGLARSRISRPQGSQSLALGYAPAAPPGLMSARTPAPNRWARWVGTTDAAPTFVGSPASLWPLADLSGTAVICPAPDLLRETVSLPSLDALLPSPSRPHGRCEGWAGHIAHSGEIPVPPRTDIVVRLPVMIGPAAASRTDRNVRPTQSFRARQPTGVYL